MGAEFIKSKVIRTIINNTGVRKIAGLDFNSKTSSDSYETIIDNYLIKIIDYNGVKVDSGNNGVMYKVETTIYGNINSKIKIGDIIKCYESNRSFIVKNNPTKGLRYLVLKVNEI